MNKYGHGARTPLHIPPRGWFDIGKSVFAKIGEDNVSLIAAGIAFYGLLAVFPGIAACMAIAGLVTEPSVIVDQLERYGQLLPQQAAEIIIGQATEVAGSREGGLGLAALAGVLIAIYSSSKGIRSMITGLNIAFDVKERRNFIMQYALTFLMTLLLIVGLLAAIASTIVLPAVFAVLPFPGQTETIVSLLRWPILAGSAIFGLSLIYRYGPARPRPRWRWITPGAVVACVLWVGGSMLFALYVRNFASYNETFGSLGGVVILLMWLWLSAFIVLLGAEVDSEMEAHAKTEPADVRSAPDAMEYPKEAVANAAETLAEARKAIETAEQAVRNAPRERHPG
ncbi:YihY/virulence factor BrkB family protein [Oricola sp.]|uniref:YihY/virulence factor BrkB family protein n=1 Tax=Oricola sp. TaxID=1979950 RepID=UPI0035184888